MYIFKRCETEIIIEYVLYRRCFSIFPNDSSILSRTIVTIALSEYGLELNLGSRLKQKRIKQNIGGRRLRSFTLEISFFFLLLHRNQVLCAVFSQTFDFNQNSICMYEKYILCWSSQFSIVVKRMVKYTLLNS